jgi:hypothetical protein
MDPQFPMIFRLFALIFVMWCVGSAIYAYRSGKLPYGRGVSMDILYLQRSKQPRLFWSLLALNILMALAVTPIMLLGHI